MEIKDINMPIYISNVDKEVSKEDIIAYIKEKTDLHVNVEKMDMKLTKDYHSYKIYIPKRKEDIIMTEDFWPKGVTYRRFIHFRTNRKDTVETQNKNNTPSKNGQIC